jgi:hypothetical protein
MTDNRLMDVRTVQRNIKSGKVTKEDYAKYLESLEDCAEMADETETDMVLHGVEAEEEAEEADA